MNNKGQTLVVFILLLPVILILLAFAFDLGDLEITKQSYENEVKNDIKYGLKHIQDPDIEKKLYAMLDANIDGNKKIEITEDTIRISIEIKKESLFKKITNNNYDINITYKGNTQNNEITKE